MTLLQGRELADAFDRSAAAYDRLVGANPGYHAHLRLAARRLGLPAGGAGSRVLDLGCGTGASTAALLRAAPQARITAVDASAGMLERARAKHWPPEVTFVHSSVETLAETGVTGPFDAAFAAYLVRNTADPDAVLAAVHGLLRPGGRLAVHEYALTGAPVHRAVWSTVCWGVVIPLGAAGPGGARLYRHLWRSVLGFDTAPALRDRLLRAGFDEVRIAPVTGWQRGIVHTFTAQRPAAAE
ncbi:methyltransferase domain-containing protein [Peterkaempfera bronchialis]|uniref:Methyltransferase domain-containing protein n=1 Tax=Peterkaempfera bronchialis TaxID=2126346 RepID=A0A345SS68_9ACTN|nr:methyltransferase domain-containing protein [Peterkaempfera bronchialis]AXI76573.1 methyltransferase domain-containing protein [Peterkaempfera bronchialis]